MSDRLCATAAPDRDDDFVNRYDRMVLDPWLTDYYGRSGFYNVGYWDGSTRDQVQACERLVDVLLGFFPSNGGTILDVACGMGGTTARLAQYYRAADITGINLSPRQLVHCRERLPESLFLPMDAACFAFMDESFDRILCVEAAFHFRSRERFLREAWRVLKPGGHIAISDIMVRDPERIGAWMFPQENAVEDLEEYTARWRQAGFRDLEIVDATEPCWKEFCRHMVAEWTAQSAAGKIPLEIYRHRTRYFEDIGQYGVDRYLLIGARKDTVA